MNKNFRVITINGIRGIFAAIFIIIGLIAGFIVSPAWACMQTWNYFMKDSDIFAQMNLFQGLILWVIIALSLYAVNNKKAVIGFGSYPGLTPEQIKSVVARAKKEESIILKKIEKEITELKAEETQNSGRNENDVNSTVQTVTAETAVNVSSVNSVSNEEETKK